MYPPGIVTRTCTVGGATAQESGDPLILSVVVASSRGLIWASTGWRLPSLPRTVASTVGSEATFELPVTSQAGFRSDSSPGTIIDVSAPGSYSHTYTATVTITTPAGKLVSQHVIGPFPLPAEDLSPVDLDTMLPVGTVAGGAVLVPDSWDAKVTAAEAAAAEAASVAGSAAAAAESATAAQTARTGAETARADIISRASEYATAPMGKNMYNPAEDAVDMTLSALGAVVPLAGYRLSDYIPVTPGLPYTITGARNWAYYDAARAFVTGSYGNQDPTQRQTLTPAAGRAFLRFSYPTASVAPSAQQMEQSPTPTEYEPWGRTLDPAIRVAASLATGPLTVTLDSGTVAVVSAFGDGTVGLGFSTSAGGNELLNMASVTLNGVTIASPTDNVAPIFTQQGTVGANHALPYIDRWPTGSHDKTVADLGSLWEAGGKQYVLLAIDSTGGLLVGRPYSIGANGEAIAETTAPTADLVHVSGATHTETLINASRQSGYQLYPWIQRRRLVILLDGTPLSTTGTYRGHELSIRETYEILDYKHVRDWAVAHIGQHYATAHHKPAVGLETEWRITPGGKARLHTALWEVSPTKLTSCGFLQSQALSGAVTRYLFGVAPIGGIDWNQGASLALLTTSSETATADLLTPGRPPTTLVDVRSDIAVAVAVDPWSGASANSARIASAPNSLWRLYSNKKIYPNVIGATNPGWGRVEVEGIMAYLTPAEALSLVADADPLNAWSELAQLC